MKLMKHFLGSLFFSSLDRLELRHFENNVHECLHALRNRCENSWISWVIRIIRVLDRPFEIHWK